MLCLFFCFSFARSTSLWAINFHLYFLSSSVVSLSVDLQKILQRFRHLVQTHFLLHLRADHPVVGDRDHHFCLSACFNDGHVRSPPQKYMAWCLMHRCVVVPKDVDAAVAAVQGKQTIEILVGRRRASGGRINYPPATVARWIPGNVLWSRHT